MKIKSLIVALVALATTATVFAQDPVNEIKKRYNEAAALCRAKNYVEALPALEQLLNDAYDNDVMEVVEGVQKLIPNCYFRIGLTKVNTDAEAALADFTAANEMALLYNDSKTARNAGSAIAELYRSMGAKSFNEKDYATAAGIFAKGYEANPQNTVLALNLAKSYCELKDFENGIKVYTEVIALKDRHSKFAEASAEAMTALTEYLMLKAQDEYVAGNKEAANATLETLVNLDPMNTANQMFRLNLAVNNEDWDCIIANAEMAAAFMMTPEEQRAAYYPLAAAYDTKNMNEQAVATYKLVSAGDKVEASKARIAELNEFLKAQAEAAK